MGRHALLTLAAAGLATGAARAGELCHTLEVPLQPTGWSASLDVPRFDPELGALTGLTLALDGCAQGAAWLESLDDAAASAATHFAATIRLRRPDGSVLLEVSPAAALQDDLAAFDGAIDFAGSSGVTHLGIVAPGQASGAAGPGPDLELFRGERGAPGVVVLPIEAEQGSSASGPAELVSGFQTSASALLTVCYQYEPDCNRNGVPDAQELALGRSRDADQDGVPDECQPAVRSLCAGDGSANGGLDCPCGNNGGPGEGCVNGWGTSALLGASGVPSVTADTLSLDVSGLPPGAQGFFLFALEATHDGQGYYFGNGLRCVEHATPLFAQGNAGVLPAPGMPALSELLAVTPGEPSYFQYWYRDPSGPCGGLDANASNAIEVVWGL